MKTQQTTIALKRDRNILLSQQGLININTRVVKDKTTYSRKDKHRQKYV